MRFSDPTTTILNPHTTLLFYLKVLHRLGVARWFVNRAGSFSKSEQSKKNIMASRKECAKAYHELHQVKSRFNRGWFARMICSKSLMHKPMTITYAPDQAM